MTVAEMIKALADQPLDAQVELRIGYTFYQDDPKVREELERALVPQADLTRSMDGRVIMTVLQLERGIGRPIPA